MRKSFTASPKDVVTAPAPTAALTRPTPAKNDNTQLEKNISSWLFDARLTFKHAIKRSIGFKIVFSSVRSQPEPSSQKKLPVIDEDEEMEEMCAFGLVQYHLIFYSQS